MTEQTISAERFAEIMSNFSSGVDRLGYIAERVLFGEQGKQEAHEDHYGRVEGLDNGQIISRQQDDATYRVDATEFMAHIERHYPDQMASAKSRVAETQVHIAFDLPESKGLSADAQRDRLEMLTAYLKGKPEGFVFEAREDWSKYLLDGNALRQDMRNSERTVIIYDIANGFAASELDAEIEQPTHSLNSDAQVDEVFAKFADDHTAAIHDLTEDRPTITQEQADRIFAGKETDEDTALMQIAEELENGFESDDPMFAELNDMVDIQRKIGIEPSRSSQSEGVSVSDFAAMADRARSAAQGLSGQDRTAEQGA